MKNRPLVPRSWSAPPADGLQGRDLAMALARIECAKAPPRPCQVYLAVHMVDERFKIGVSENPVARFELLPDAGQIDLSVSMVRRFNSRERANQVEKALHRALAHEQMHNLRGDGRTEWFHRRALGAAQLILSSISDAGEAHLPGRRQRSLAPTIRVLHATAANIQKAADAINLWREAGKRYPLHIRIDKNRRVLIFKGYGADKGNLSAQTLRMRLIDLDASYALRSLRRVPKPPTLIRLVSYADEARQDLSIELQPAVSFARVLAGRHVEQQLSDGLELLRLESQIRRRGI